MFLLMHRNRYSMKNKQQQGQVYRNSLQTGAESDSISVTYVSTVSNKQAVNLQFDLNMNSHIPAHAIVMP